jgi:acyl-CoA thioesterase I
MEEREEGFMKHFLLKAAIMASIAFFACGGKPAEAATKTILAIGDSLTAGYGLRADESFPAQLEKKLKADGHDVKVINAGVSGETSSGMLTRFEWTLQQNPDCIIIETGANDMLRGIDPKELRANLKKMLETAKARKIPVLLAGMRSFRNLGGFFADSFQGVYKDLADEYDAVYYPFFLEGVAMDAQLNLSDGLHPNAAGIAIIVDGIYDDVEDLLDKKVE